MVSCLRFAAILISMSAFTSAAHARQYDPLALAVNNLSFMGYPPPQGYTIKEVPFDSIGGGRLSKTDSGAGIIDVDVASVITTIVNHGDGSPSAIVGALVVILHHEYSHTPDHGTPTPEYGGYGNGPCAHGATAAEGLELMCGSVICDTSDPSARHALCTLHSQWVDNFNFSRETINAACDPNLPSQHGCACCT